MNIFNKMPEFITLDVRVKRPVDVSYRIDGEFMHRRHSAMLQAATLNGKRVLDLGCAVAATGAWVLAHGAAHYTGVELQSRMAADARLALGQHFDRSQWDIINQSIEDFLAANTGKFDIVVVSGVIYGIADYFSFLKQITSIASEAVVIESMHPWKIIKADGTLTPMEEWRKAIDYPMVQYCPAVRHSHESGTKSYEYDGVRISVSAFQQIFGHLGWAVDLSANEELATTVPDVYDVDHVVRGDTPPERAHLVNTASGPRFVIRCYPATKSKFDFIHTFTKPEPEISFKEWK